MYHFDHRFSRWAVMLLKNPNGYGTITKLSGNRRKSWIVKEGKSEKQKPIGYTATKKEEGLILLAQNNNPRDIKTDKITLGKVKNEAYPA